MNLVCDGGCKSNGNNPTAMMWRVYDMNKRGLVADKTVTKLVEGGKELELTNNKAELCALVEAARIATRGSTIKTDSNVVLSWVTYGLPEKTKAKDKEFIARGIAAAQQLIQSKKLNVIKFVGSKNPADCK